MENRDKLFVAAFFSSNFCAHLEMDQTDYIRPCNNFKACVEKLWLSYFAQWAGTVKNADAMRPMVLMYVIVESAND